MAAIRYTFADTARSIDDQLSGLVGDFPTMMADGDLVGRSSVTSLLHSHHVSFLGCLLLNLVLVQTVRRLALSALNSAARNKPHLIRDSLNKLLPSIYKETLIREDLIRTVQMGPWKHKVDDGLEARKTAFETMYTLVSLLEASIICRDWMI